MLVTESSPLKYIYYQLLCVMVTFYHRKNRLELRWLSLGFFGSAVLAIRVCACKPWKNKFASTAGTFQLKSYPLFVIFMCTTIVLLSWNFTLCCHFLTFHLETWITFWSYVRYQLWASPFNSQYHILIWNAEVSFSQMSII